MTNTLFTLYVRHTKRAIELFIIGLFVPIVHAIAHSKGHLYSETSFGDCAFERVLFNKYSFIWGYHMGSDTVFATVYDQRDKYGMYQRIYAWDSLMPDPLACIRKLYR